MKPFFAMPADGWYNIAIAGEFPHSTGYVQVLDGDAFKAIVEDIHTQQGKPNWPGILVDFDHDSLDPARPSTAAGWLTDIEERPDGLWAQIRWSDTGQKALEGGSFRFVSPVWMVDDCEDLGDKRLRPKRLMNCAITNCPNIKGMIPLTNRTDAGDKSRFSPPARPLPFVERVSVPLAALRAIEGDVLENARRPLTDKQRKLLWARSSENGGSPYQGSPSKRVRDLLKKNPNASTNDIIKARTGNREAQATYHKKLQQTRNEWKGQEDDAREKAKKDRKLIGGSSHYDWTRRSSGERKSGTKLKTGTGLPKSGKSADLEQRRGNREDAAKERLNLSTQYKGKLTVDSLNRAMDRLNEHRQQRKEYAGVSHSKKPLGNRALFLANTAWEDMTDQQRRWWWASMGGSGPNGASRIDPYSPDGGTASPIAFGAGASGSLGPTRANEFWNEVYGNVDNPDWQPTISEVDSMWGSVGTGATDDDWRSFFQRSAAGNQKLRDDFAEISRREAAEPVYSLPDTSFLDGLAGGFLHGMGNVGAAAVDLAVGYGRQGVDFALNSSLLGAAIARLPAVKQGLDSFYFSVGNKAKDALGIFYLQDQGDVSRTADTISGWSSLIGVAALDAALGMSWENLSRTPAGKLGGSLNPFNKVKAVEIPKPGVGNYETAYIQPTKRQLAADLKRFDEIVNAHFAPEGVDYVASRASLRDLEQSVSALTDIGRETYTGQVKAFEEALESWRNAYSGGGLSSKLRAAERSRVKELANLPTTAAERAAIEEAAYAREMWGMPDSTAKALYQDDLARLSQDAARRKMGDSMGRDVFEKAEAKAQIERWKQLGYSVDEAHDALRLADELDDPIVIAEELHNGTPESIERFNQRLNEARATRDKLLGVTPENTPAASPAAPKAPAVPRAPLAPATAPATGKPLSGDVALARLRQQAAIGDTAPGTWDQLDEWADRVRRADVAFDAARAAGATPSPVSATPASSKPLGKAGIPPPGHKGAYHPQAPLEGESVEAYFARTGNRQVIADPATGQFASPDMLPSVAKSLEYPSAADFKTAESLVYPGSWAKASPEAQWNAAHHVHVLDGLATPTRSEIYASLRAIDGESLFPTPKPKTSKLSPEAAAKVRELDFKASMRAIQERMSQGQLPESTRRSILEATLFPNLHASATELGAANFKTLAAISLASLPVLGIASSVYRYFKKPVQPHIVSDVQQTTAPTPVTPPPATPPPVSYTPPTFPSNIVNFALAGKYGVPSDGDSQGPSQPTPPALAPVPPAEPTAEQVELVRRNAGTAAKQNAASLQIKIAQLEKEKADLLARTYLVPVPEMRPTEYQNIQQVRRSAAAQPGATAASIIAAVEKAQRENAAVSSLKMDIRKAMKGSSTDRQRARAEEDELRQFNAPYYDALELNATNDKHAARRLERIEVELGTLSRAYRSASERAGNAEDRAEKSLRSQMKRDSEKAERANARAQRDYEREVKRAYSPASVRGEVSRERRANYAFFTALESRDFTAAGQMAPTFTRDQLDKAARTFVTVMAARTPEQQHKLRQYYLPYADPSGFVEWSQGAQLNPNFTYENPLATDRERHAMITQKQTEDRYFRRY